MQLVYLFSSFFFCLVFFKATKYCKYSNDSIINHMLLVYPIGIVSFTSQSWASFLFILRRSGPTLSRHWLWYSLIKATLKVERIDIENAVLALFTNIEWIRTSSLVSISGTTIFCWMGTYVKFSNVKNWISLNFCSGCAGTTRTKFSRRIPNSPSW